MERTITRRGENLRDTFLTRIVSTNTWSIVVEVENDLLLELDQSAT